MGAAKKGLGVVFSQPFCIGGGVYFFSWGLSFRIRWCRSFDFSLMVSEPLNFRPSINEPVTVTSRELSSDSDRAWQNPSRSK